MKVLLFNGSPRANGCTFTALSEIAGILNAQGIEAGKQSGVPVPQRDKKVKTNFIR